MATYRLDLMTQDHPRIRGEHSSGDDHHDSDDGSSPHTRGARVAEALFGHFKGIIPAYAGSTRRRRARSVAMPDHPRIRGEHVQMNRAIADGSGSSPHTRGAQLFTSPFVWIERIIPAYAGSTRGGLIDARTQQDHPRIRGEHSGPLGGVQMGVGSSPHTRGAPLHGDRVDVHPGIIPAYAGSTSFGSRTRM